jgi:hypothetical protein
MEFLSEFTPSAAKCFGIFFSFSFAILGIILVIGLVGRLAHFRRCVRQLLARRTRNERMLADRKKLRADALKLEGIYYFEDPDYDYEDEDYWLMADYEDAGDSRASDAA